MPGFVSTLKLPVFACACVESQLLWVVGCRCVGGRGFSALQGPRIAIVAVPSAHLLGLLLPGMCEPVRLPSPFDCCVLSLPSLS